MDWSDVDWSKGSSVIAREMGVSRQAVAAARKRHAPEGNGQEARHDG